MSFVAKIILVELGSSLSLSFADKAKWFVLLIFNLNLQLINGISSHFEKLFKYFIDIAIILFFKIIFAPSASVFPNN